MELFYTGVIIKTEQMFQVLTAGRVLAPSFHSAFLDENKQFWLASGSNDIWLAINSVIGLAAGGSGKAVSRWGWPCTALMPIAPTPSFPNEPQPRGSTRSWGALVWTMPEHFFLAGVGRRKWDQRKTGGGEDAPPGWEVITTPESSSFSSSF